MSYYWHENHFMVVQGPALSKELSLLGVVPVDFKTSGRTNNILQSSLPPSGTFLHGEHRVKTHCSWWHWQDRWVAGAGRRGFSIRSSFPLGHLQHHLILDGTVVRGKGASPAWVSFAEENEASLS